VPDLKLLLAKVDDLHCRFEFNRQVTQERLDTIQLEMAATRAEMKAFRAEMDALCAAFHSQRGLPPDEGNRRNESSGDEQTVRADGHKKYRVN
jgi:hypothetical protein